MEPAFDQFARTEPAKSRAKIVARPRIEAKRPMKLRDKVNVILRDASVVDFGDFLERFYPNQERNGAPEKQELGVLLKYLRLAGKLSPEIDGFIADQLIDTIYVRLKDDLADDSPLQAQIEKLAKREIVKQEDVEYLLKTYANMARIARRTQAKLAMGLETSETESRQLDSFNSLQFNLIDDIPPATLLKHFMRNGDLSWLWGLDNSTTIQDLDEQKKTNGLFGKDGAEW